MSRRPLKKLSKRRAVVFLLTFVLCAIYSLFDDSPALRQAQCDIPEVANTVSPDRNFIRVCTWNVHNYNVSNRRVNGRWISYPKPEAERQAVANVLVGIDADIVLLQEMGDMTYLRELKMRLDRAGSKYPFVAVSDYDSPARLAILSKIRPECFLDLSDIKFKLKHEQCYSPRGTLGAKFKFQDRELFIFNLHLKSKVNAKKKDENFIPFRFAELRAICKNVKKLTSSDSLIIYAGDFNDEPTKALLRNLGDVVLVQQSDKTGSSFTYHWRKKDILYKYDYFLVSRNLQPLLSTAVVCEHQNGSDHKPVYVDMAL